MKARLTLKAGIGLANLVVVLGLALFGSAGTLRYFEGWVFLGLFTAVSLAITVYLARTDPALLARRTQAGPFAEKERSQKTIQGIASISFLATVIVPALDRRFAWSYAPLPVVVLGNALVFTGFFIVFRVFLVRACPGPIRQSSARDRERAARIPGSEHRIRGCVLRSRGSGPPHAAAYLPSPKASSRTLGITAYGRSTSPRPLRSLRCSHRPQSDRKSRSTPGPGIPP